MAYSLSRWGLLRQAGGGVRGDAWMEKSWDCVLARKGVWPHQPDPSSVHMRRPQRRAAAHSLRTLRCRLVLFIAHMLRGEDENAMAQRVVRAH
jgi:hypothetical protein